MPFILPEQQALGRLSRLGNRLGQKASWATGWARGLVGLAGQAMLACLGWLGYRLGHRTRIPLICIS